VLIEHDLAKEPVKKRRERQEKVESHRDRFEATSISMCSRKKAKFESSLLTEDFLVEGDRQILDSKAATLLKEMTKEKYQTSLKDPMAREKGTFSHAQK